MNTATIKANASVSRRQPTVQRQGFLKAGGTGAVIHYLQPSAGQVWVAARGSIPLTSAYLYDPNDPGICALPGAGLTVYAHYISGISCDITEKATYSTVDSRIARISDHGTIVGVKSGSTMLDISFRGVKARVKVHVVERSAEAYSNAISMLAERGNPRYSFQNKGQNACCRFVEDVLRIMGLSLPQKAWTGDFYKWINRQEARCSGWYEVKDPKEAFRFADLGHPVLAVSPESVALLNPSNTFTMERGRQASGSLSSRWQNMTGLLCGSLAESAQCFVHV